MSAEEQEIAERLAARDRHRRRLLEQETPEQRMERHAEMQRAAFELLRASPEGWRRFLERNMKSRRTEYRDGKWRLVAPERQSY